MLEPVIRDAVDRALTEDLGDGDITSEATVDERARARAVITQKQPGVIAGLAVAEQTFRRLDPDVTLERLAKEGRWRDGGPVLAIEGSARAILAGERTALNFLARLSGVATMAACFVRAVEGTGVQILDTRKTTPGLRALEKAAVATGGAVNHRAGLYDAVLIKENHSTLAGGVGEAVRRAQERAPHVPLEVECRNIAEVDEAIEAGARRILLDNMTTDELQIAARHVDGRAQLEASGGATLETLPEIAGTGIQFISVGAITHSAPALDLSLILEPIP